MSNSETLEVIPESKKQIRAAVATKLSDSLAGYMSIIGEKKFKKELDKTARRLGTKFYKALPKKEQKTK